jgi:hypothetical protein
MKLMSKTASDSLQALTAVLLGNLVYYLLMRHLPVRAQHVPFQMDFGVLVDFCFCVGAFGIIKTVARSRHRSR